ncbi:hypothetical protein MUK42_00619 [Musa troglodytarum]|uniref:Uncharacterized protein n=1 Tax=Musa troglodytarum TaxID=320322 RepID=A0A9E7JU44_9LILI|nr:hypothetical protein MUK42_00619 [Musa troglodytarum]
MDDSEGTPDQKITLAKEEEEEGGATVPASELAQEVVAEVIEEEVTAVPVSQEAQDASLELEQPEEREPEAPAAGVLEDLSSAAAAAVVPADGPPPANEEVVPVANAVAETSNACVEAEPLSSETAEESVPALNSLVSQAPRDGTELCRETEASTGMRSFPSCYH